MRDLYHPTIIGHSKSPSNFMKEVPTNEKVIAVEAYNPLCGDEFTLYISKSADVIEKVQFSGYGCAVSKAMTSLLTVHLEGKNLKEAKILLEELKVMLTKQDASPTPTLKDFVPFMEVKNHPERMTCVTLSIDALVDYLNPR